MTAGAPKSPNNVTSTFSNTVHLLLKDLRLEHGGTKLDFLPRVPYNLVKTLGRVYLVDWGRLCYICYAEGHWFEPLFRWRKATLRFGCNTGFGLNLDFKILFGIDLQLSVQVFRDYRLVYLIC